MPSPKAPWQAKSNKEVAMQSCDFLVIGGGLAGLSYALEVAAHGSVVLLTKTALEESNTRYAQGGIAAVWRPPDTALPSGVSES